MIKMWIHWIQNHLYADDRGMGTIEVVIIIAVLVMLGFLFKDFATDFFVQLTTGIKDDNQIDQLF